MGTQRASNKDILGAIEALTAAITGSMQAPVTAAPAPVSVEPAPTGETDIKVDPDYLDVMTRKVQAACDTDGNDRILYARKNQRGEQKIAYCLASNWTTLKDKGLQGAIKHMHKA